MQSVEQVLRQRLVILLLPYGLDTETLAVGQLGVRKSGNFINNTK